MAFDVANTLLELETHMNNTGLFSVAQIGEPTNPWVGDGFFGAVWMVTQAVVAVYLGGDTKELHVATLRIYRDAFRQEQEIMELQMSRVVGQTMERIVEDFTQRGEMRNVDIGAEEGVKYEATYGYITLADVTYRVADIIVPMIVDGSATAVA